MVRQCNKVGFHFPKIKLLSLRNLIESSCDRTTNAQNPWKMLQNAIPAYFKNNCERMTLYSIPQMKAYKRNCDSENRTLFLQTVKPFLHGTGPNCLHSQQIGANLPLKYQLTSRPTNTDFFLVSASIRSGNTSVSRSC